MRVAHLRDDWELLGSSESVGEVIGGLLGTLFCKLEVKLDGMGGLSVGVGGEGESTGLKELGKELGGDEEGRTE